VEKQFQMAHGGGVRLWLYTQDLPEISKGIEVKCPVTESQIEIVGPDSIKIGTPIAVGNVYSIILRKKCRNREFSLKNPGKDTIIWS